jgi:hypothetical protein
MNRLPVARKNKDNSIQVVQWSLNEFTGPLLGGSKQTITVRKRFQYTHVYGQHTGYARKLIL